jgi:predicted ester cyclase
MPNLLRHLALGLLLVACERTPAIPPAEGARSAKQKESTVTESTPERNKRIVRRVFDECINGKNLALLPELVAPDFVGAQGARGPAAFSSVIEGLRAAFPDIHYTLEDVIAEGDRVVVRWTWVGTHEHQYREHKATGKRVKNSAIAIFALEDQKLARLTLEMDRLGFLQAMGAVPEGLGGPPPKTN